MTSTIFQTIVAGFIASVAWFIVGGALYKNSWVDRIYKKFGQAPGLKQWSSTGKYLVNMYIFGILLQCLLFAFVYAFIQPVFPGSVLGNTLFFGMIVLAVKILPRLFDMWIQSTYPDKLLVVEFVNGALGGFIIAFVFALML